jgi:hypothetical protein
MKKVVIIILSSCALVKAIAQTGIGTTAPVNKLHIEATTVDPATSGSSANGNLRLSGSGASHVLDFGLSSSSNFSWLQARSKSNYSTNYNLLLNPNGGLVGIGTTSPFTTLTVGNTAGTVSGEITINPQAALNEGGQITIKKSLNGSTVDWTIDQYGTTSSNARLRIFNGNSETNGITILENGNVGFGNINPTAKLNLTGGGLRLAGALNNANSRPGINTSSIGNFEIRGTGSGGSGSTQGEGADDGFLRLSAGGGTNANTQSSIDLSGFSTVADMNNNIVMRTAGSERVRIDPSGYLGIGTSSPRSKLHVQTADQTSVYIESTTTDNNGMLILNANTDQNWSANWHEFMYFQKQGNALGWIAGSNSGTGISYNTSSDYRLKTDLRNFSGLDIVNKIKTYDFAWKANNSRMHGVMAHELQEILPYAVTGIKDAVDENGKMIIQGVDYGRITPVLVKAIQEQDLVIKEQGVQIKNLKREKELIEKRLSDLERIIKKTAKKQHN